MRIASTADEFAEAIGAALNEDADERKGRVDEFLSNMSWDLTHGEMSRLIDATIASRQNGLASSAKGAAFS